MKFLLKTGLFYTLGMLIICLVKADNYHLPLWIFAFVCVSILYLIYWVIYKTVKFSGEVISTVAELIEVTITGIVDLLTIEDEVKKKGPNAFKILIQEKKKMSVKVGIFDKNSSPIQQMEITSDDGVSKDLIVGKEYIL